MQQNPCYTVCNQIYKVTQPSFRLYCKKGCDGDGDTINECKRDFCGGLCIKDTLGEDDNKKGAWTTLLARAPMASDDCLEACISGCGSKVEDND